MKVSTYNASIRSIRPLIMHNGRLANPMDPHAKALKSLTNRYKTSKSDDDFEAICKAEFIGSLYHDSNLGPYIPAEVLQAVIINGARKRRLGPKFEAFVSIVEPDGVGYKLDYSGPRDVEGMFANSDIRFTKLVGVNQARIMRTRARFPKWELSFNIEVIEGGPDKDQIEEALHDAGLLCGIGDWRETYGKFSLINFKELN